MKGGAYQASSLCLYGTDTTYPWKALLKPCGDLQGQPSCHMWLAQTLCMTAVANRVPPPPCQPSKERCPQLEPVVASSRASLPAENTAGEHHEQTAERSPEPASFEQRDPRAEAVPMGRVSPIYLLTRREGRRGAWQRTREGSAVSAHPGGHTHRHSACNAEPEETTSPKAACVRCLGRLVAKGMCSACDKRGRAVCHQCYLKANETGINNCAVESLSVAPCLSLTIYIS